MKCLGSDSKETIIFEAELLALVVAMSQWSPVFQGCPVVFFVDNNSAQDVAISGSARNQTANIMIDALLRVEAESSSFPWYARVPSPSNPSDELSRGDLSFFTSLGTPRVCVLDWVNEISKCLVIVGQMGDTLRSKLTCKEQIFRVLDNVVS